LDLFNIQGKLMQTLFHSPVRGGKFTVPYGANATSTQMYCAVLRFGNAQKVVPLPLIGQ
jgi:hypothetical protein